MPGAFLFVYGSLMREARGPMGARERGRLEAEADYVGRGWVAGRLFNLGAYPGLIAAGIRDERVSGDVFRLAREAVTLAWLDVYEGIRPEAPGRAPYRRVIRAIDMVDGRRIEAWLYLYRGPGPRWRQIHSGHWGGRG